MYCCTKCKSVLNTPRAIIFLAETKSGNKGLLLLNPHLGEYTYNNLPGLKFAQGESVEFFCPVCQHNLSAKSINKNLVHLKMRDLKGKYFDIYFSKIAGEQSTFLLSENKIIEKYGENSSSYLDYFNAKLKDLKT